MQEGMSLMDCSGRVAEDVTRCVQVVCCSTGDADLPGIWLEGDSLPIAICLRWPLVPLLALTDPLDRGWLLGHKWKISSPLVSTPTLSVHCYTHLSVFYSIQWFLSALYQIFLFP
jgi:hypothetical protein